MLIFINNPNIDQRIFFLKFCRKKDELEKVYLFEEGTETKILYNEKEVSLNRLKTAKRDGAGTKARK